MKNPSADVTWQKGAKRQMANLDRFMDELQTFDEREMNDHAIKVIEDMIKKIDSQQVSSESSSSNHPYSDALNTLYKWIRGVVKYHSLMLNYVKPLFKKVEEIEKEVKEADHKLTTLNRKSEVKY